MTPTRSLTPDRPDRATWRAWGIDPEWSRLLEVPGHDGHTHRWHVLDTGPGSPDAPTILCVHGNPTWGYAWKSFLRRFGSDHRVIAVDQLGMGYSDRLDPSWGPRRYEARVADLVDVVGGLDLDPTSPLVLAAHDWGGAIAMGWAVDHPDDVAGMVLCNTGIAVPAGRDAPKIIRLAASAPLRDLVCRRTSLFVEGTIRLSGSRLSRVDRVAFRAPYRSAELRRSIAGFVGDVPFTDEHPSAPALDEVATALPTIDAPVLLAWGARDIVFDDDFAADLLQRLPDARLHRFADANHLVMAEVDVASTVDVWMRDLVTGEVTPRASGPHDSSRPSSVFDGLRRRRNDDEIAIADLAAREQIDFATFARRVESVAAGLLRRGLAPGDRVAMLTPPGIDLVVAVYGVWRAGGVTVVADRGLGLRALGRAIASTRPAWTIGPRRAKYAARLMRWAPGAVHVDVGGLIGEDLGATALPAEPTADAAAAILFTSGATGPPKGVRYRHGQLAAQRDALAATYGIDDTDRLVAAFAPFALYGPALGVPTALTDCDVTTPGDLSVDALDEACREIGATMAFASPAALANVVKTARGSDGERQWSGISDLRLVFSAGAPVPAETLHRVQRLAPDASVRTPYGMTEALPVADIDLPGIDEAERSGEGRGVCVGTAVEGADARIASLGFDPLAGEPLSNPVGETGEILVRSAWVSDGYDGLWRTERMARPGGGWHRTGDVGHLDGSGRLWVEGRTVHLIETSGGIVTPVPVERAVERALAPSELVDTGRVAAVGVGPRGCQQVVVVVERPELDPGLADRELAGAVRSVVDVDIAAVLVTKTMPVDIRHNAKIDRSAVADWASDMLA